MCLAHGLAWQAEVTQGGAEDLGGYEASPGSPDGSVVTHGETPLHRNCKETLMQEIIWWYYPELAVKLWLQSKEGDFKFTKSTSWHFSWSVWVLKCMTFSLRKNSANSAMPNIYKFYNLNETHNKPTYALSWFPRSILTHIPMTHI